ncbi:MAG: Hsp20/alpha crystallin family protein [Oligoflexia bacterium]|nr:Hsp20/alpha crystallin family protein [Oligoflexia bacterium]
MPNRSGLPEMWSGTWTPMRELTRMQRRLDQLLDDTGFAPQGSEEAGMMREFAPPCDVREVEDHIVVSFDMPGVRREDLRVEVLDNQLVVTGEKHSERHEKEGRSFTRERHYGTFRRALTLPAGISPERVEARYENGVLQIAFPKMEETRSKSIPIQERKGGILERLASTMRDRKSDKVA